MIAANPERRPPINVDTRCRICQSPEIVKAGEVEFFFGFDWPIWDCGQCGCRFTRHEDDAYDRLHSERGSCYARYRELATNCKKFFDNKDLAGLRRQLSQTAKYRFVIDQLGSLDRSARMMEVGCARGFLTSYFILGGWETLGVDVSEDAVASAITMFGNHFAMAGAAEMETRAPYDAIYHVGTIGCVRDPVGMTERLLGLLKPSGLLLFNAPNRDACHQRNQLWFDSAPPPDLVTMFPRGFWVRRFSKIADVREEVEMLNAENSLTITLRQLFHRSWRHPVPLGLGESARSSVAEHRIGDNVWNLFERAIRKGARIMHLSRLAPKQPSEYGLFVTMRRR
jgi:SAM-dependent methyltransferase